VVGVQGTKVGTTAHVLADIGRLNLWYHLDLSEPWEDKVHHYGVIYKRETETVPNANFMWNNATTCSSGTGSGGLISNSSPDGVVRTGPSCDGMPDASPFLNPFLDSDLQQYLT
jgi:hypothetical protein